MSAVATVSPRVKGGVIFSLNSFCAAMLALFVAFAAGLPRPIWAVLTVYLTAQPLTGALRAKAVYRLLGTLIGGIAAVIMVPRLVDAPVLLSLALASWTGLCLGVSLLDRTPRSYLFMLAGYTAAIIGFAAVATPGAVFELALARGEEISVGVVCAALVHTIFFPSDVGQRLSRQIAVSVRDAQLWAGDALRGRKSPAERKERERLAADITELHITASHLPFDTTELPLRVNTVRAVEHRLGYLLPLLESVEDQLDQMGKIDPALDRLLGDLAEWLETPAAQEEQAAAATRVAARCAALAPPVAAGASWETVLRCSVLARLQLLIEATQDSRELAGHVAAPDAPVTERVKALLSVSWRRTLHLDYGLAVIAGLCLFAALMLCCGIWIQLDWPDGSGAATAVAIFGAFFASQDDPTPSLAAFLGWSLVSIPIAAVYLFGILPRIDGFPMLALALAPTLIGLAYLQSLPRWAPRVMPVLMTLLLTLSLQGTFSANIGDFVNGNLAQIIGIAVALAVTVLIRSFSGHWMAQRIVRRGWAELVEMANRRGAEDPAQWMSAMLDRVGLVHARAAVAKAEAAAVEGSGLTDLQIGLELLQLRTLAGALPAAQAAAARAVLQEVAQLYQRRLDGEAAPSDGRTLQVIDRMIKLVAGHPSEPRATPSLAALVGLRLGLFPEATPYRAGAATS